ncbi:MAG: hypothetical protein ABH840_00425 [Nanoarchaeota archaeon]
MKKSFIFGFIVILMIFISLASVIAANIDVSKKVVSDVVISELDEPAFFNFTITNRGGNDNFEIYSLVGADFTPRGTFNIPGGGTSEIEARVYPEDQLKYRIGLVSFTYNIKGQGAEIYTDTLTLNVVNFKDAISIGTENIKVGDIEAKVIVKNNFNFNFPELKAKFSSAFFKDFEETFSLKPLESKEIVVSLDKSKVLGLSAGQYLLSAEIEAGETKEEFTGGIKFVEKSGLVVSEKSSGIVFRENIIEKSNEGNIPTLSEITIKKDIFSRLFTQFNSEPTSVIRKGLVVYYSWSEQLKPGDSLIVKSNTNYLYPLLIIAVIIILAYLVFLYTFSPLILRKKVGFVKAKGGEFALKISISVSSRKFVEKISIADRFPGIVKIYEKFGAFHPDKVDHINRRLVWNIESLQPGEERILSYIVYSKVGVVGKFELPPTVAVYEKDGKIREARSNKAFFMNEPRKRED